MSTLRPTTAKIMQHGDGLGAPCAQEVRHRAQELAFIGGRAEFSEEDWRCAKRELHGGHDGVVGDDEFEMVMLVSAHDGVVTDLGHHVANVMPDDAINIVEELISEGMDEAFHEQMLASQRDQREHEASDARED